MRQERGVAFFAGFISTGFILAVIIFGMALITFNLGGGETLRELEAHRTMMLGNDYSHFV